MLKLYKVVIRTLTGAKVKIHPIPPHPCLQGNDPPPPKSRSVLKEKICLSTILAPSLNCDPPERQLLPSAPTCHFRVNMWAKEWQPWARARSADCQHSGCSLSARREANRQTAGSSRAWWGLLDRVQNSSEHLTATPHNSCSLDSGSFACIYIFATHVCLMPVETRRGHYIHY